MQRKISKVLLERVKDGEEKTAPQWALELYGDDSLKKRMLIDGAVARLQRNGENIAIVKTDERTAGVVKMLKNPGDAIRAYNRHVSKCVEPKIEATFKKAENILVNHPKLREAVIERAKDLLRLAANSQKSLLGLPYDGTNRQIETRPDKPAKV